MPPSTSDNDDYDSLLARLTALKGSNAPPAFLTKPETTPTERNNDDVESRFRRLAAGEELDPAPRKPIARKLYLPSETVHNEEDDQTLEELLAELNVGKELGDLKDDEDVNALLKEVRSAVLNNELAYKEPTSQSLSPGTKSEGPREPDKIDEVEQFGTWDPGDERAADEYISQVLAELELERKYSPLDESNEQQGEIDKEFAAESDPVAQRHGEEAADSEEIPVEAAESPLDLPTAPSDQLPELTLPGTQPIDETSLAARLAKLSLPSTPSSLVGKQQRLPKYTDDDIDSWCIICNDDATVRCLGCDGDLYCQNCWNEGHRGSDAGFEERQHKALAYVKDKRRKKVAI